MSGICVSFMTARFALDSEVTITSLLKSTFALDSLRNAIQDFVYLGPFHKSNRVLASWPIPIDSVESVPHLWIVSEKG